VDESYVSLCEQSLSRIATALGRKFLLPLAFERIPRMIVSHDWRARHAGLIAMGKIAASAKTLSLNSIEDLFDEMYVVHDELGKIIESVVMLFLVI
jgi:importin-5